MRLSQSSMTAHAAARCRAAFASYIEAMERARCLRDELAWLKPRPRTVRRCEDLERRIGFAEDEAAFAVREMRDACRAVFCTLSERDREWTGRYFKRMLKIAA